MSKRGRRGGARSRNDGWEESGGYMAAKKCKLDIQYNEMVSLEQTKEGTSSNIFNGISIYVNGYTKPSSDELKRLMMLHGGKYCHFFSKTNCSHVIANNLPDSKVKDWKYVKTVKPEWVTDSIKAGKQLSCTPYTLYVAPSVMQPTINFAKVSEDQRHMSETATVCKAQSVCNTSTHVPSTNVQKVNQNAQTKDSRNEGFIKEFYDNSRLHLISTLGAEFKDFVTKLHQTGEKVFPGRQRLLEHGIYAQSPSKQEQVIMHIDMDSFFVSVGLRNRPDLVGKPVAVTHSKGKMVQPREGTDFEYELSHWKGFSLSGNTNLDADTKQELVRSSVELEKSVSMAEIASCSYEARQAGVKNGMFMGPARKLCPNLVPIPYEFEGYREVAHILYNVVASYTHHIEAISCDEMFIDCTDILQSTGISEEQLASTIRDEVKDKTGCNASIGIGPNILIARMATRVAKPNGQHLVHIDDIQHFIAKQLAKDLPGVGRKTCIKLQALGVTTCSDLQAISLAKLQKEFGAKLSESLFEFARGKDDRPIQMEKERKSVSAEVNYGIRFKEQTEVTRFINDLAEEVQTRLRRLELKGRTLTLKLKVRKSDAPKETIKFLGHGICDSIAKSTQLISPTDDAQSISKQCLALIKILNVEPEDYRGVGIQISRLERNDKLASKSASILKYMKQGTNIPDTASVHIPKVLPDLPTLKLDNPEPGGHASVPKQAKTPTGIAAQGSSDYMVSPSQIDENVLQELPKDIQDQIRKEMRLHQMKKINTAAGGKQTQEDVVPKQETLSISSLRQSPTIKSPKKKSPSKNSPKIFKVPKGSKVVKKKKLSPKKIVFQDPNQHEIPPPVRHNKTSIDVSIKPVVSSQPEEIEFCGARSINEVKLLIKEWLYNTDTPLQEDILMLVEYLVQLVVAKNLEEVYLLSKFLHRHVLRIDTGEWKRAVDIIEQKVNDVIHSIYSSKLKLSN
ncbi:unnamed protein product [Owenia fusiformis]|uniref:DNA repair protein REV1 n=1 Tax=Owenia fusiformis TaxID=6347 RepID=A0A8S4NPV1_OWEFU|nr:unnamed protein product [Owenia fusiformis]